LVTGASGGVGTAFIDDAPQPFPRNVAAPHDRPCPSGCRASRGSSQPRCRLGSIAVVSDKRGPVPFEAYQPGVYLHGTKADLAVREMLTPGRESNFEGGGVMNSVYFTATLDAATWGAELATGEGPGRIYVVEPTGEFESDPNLTDKKFPGNPTQSF